MRATESGGEGRNVAFLIVMRRECRTLSAVRQSGAGGLAAGQAALDNPAQPQKKKKYIVSIPITKVSARYRYTHTHLPSEACIAHCRRPNCFFY